MTASHQCGVDASKIGAEKSIYSGVFKNPFGKLFSTVFTSYFAKNK